MRGKPVRHHMPLETQFSLEQSIERLAILESVAAIDSLVRTHHRDCSRTNGVGNGLEVRLMHCFVVYVRADGFDCCSIDT